MANTIRIRRSATSGATPTTSQLALGELAINTYDGKLFLKKDDGSASVIEIGGSPATLASVATSGSYLDLSNRPTLANVATSGSYADLSNKPTIPAAVTNNNQLTNGAGYITSADGGNADTLDGYHFNVENGPSAAGNFGQWYAHSSYSNANTVPSAWGWTFLNGSTNAPNSNSSDWYRGRFSLGNSYGYGSDTGDYWMEMAIPRSSQGGTPGNLWVRTCENGAEQSWYQVAATISGNTTWHAGNDGAGSGLDADLLDGQQGSYYLDYNNLTNVPAAGGSNADTLDGLDSGDFLRSNANDTATGQITFSYDDDTNDFAQIYVRGSDNHSGIVINPVASKQAHLRFYNNGTEKWQWRVPFQDSSDAEMMLYSWNASSDLYKFNHNGTATFNGGTVWTSVNDGSGSGLDADTLDGMNSSSSVVANTIVARQANGYIYANHINFSTSETENLTINSFFTSNGDGWSRKSSKAHVISQLGLYTTSNDGSGSGLDADTVDGIQAASFLRSDADDTMVGKLQITPSGFDSGIQNLGCINISSAGSGETRAIDIDGSWGTNENKSISFIHGGAASNLVGQINCLYTGSSSEFRFGRFYHGGDTSAYPIVMQSTGSTTANLLVNGSTVWHAGNDGSGSGLDADLWDGNQFASYLNQAVLTTSAPTFADIYNTAWFRNQSAGIGLYNTATSQHFYSASAAYWHLNSTNGLILYGAYNASAGNATNRKGYLYHDTNGFGLLGQAGSWAVNIRPTGTDVVFGGHTGNNHYNSVSSARISFGGGNDFTRYSVGTSLENYGGNYTKLDLRWHTGIRMGGQAAYGGTRIYNDEAFTTLLFSVGRSDGNTRVESGSLLIGGNTAWHAGNDGAGTGLDADTVDGVQVANLLGTHQTNNLNITNKGYYTTGTSGQNQNSGTIPYGWGYQISGAWSHPYPDIVFGYHTGMRFGGHTSYGGCRFYADHPGSTTTMLFSVGNGNSDVHVSNNLTAGGNITAYSSDRRLKKNFKNLESAISKVSKLNGCSFDWVDNIEELGFTPDFAKNDVGLIAQEVEAVCPQAVAPAPFDHEVDIYAEEPKDRIYKSISGDNYLTVKYEKLVPLLVEAIKELKAEIDTLKAEKN